MSLRSALAAAAAAVTSLAMLGAAPVQAISVSATDTDVRSVTLVGSLQSELGCEDDWRPACTGTHLAVDKATGVWSGTFTVPAGDYEFKVALNDTWDESYGGPGGANVPLVLSRAAKLTFTYNSQTDQVAVAPAEQPSAKPTAADRALVGNSLRTPLTKERFYFVMADRFANGDPTNDRGGLTGDRLSTGFDPSDKGFFHGGDVAGLRNKLDYIQGLGTTAIWLTPSFKNRPVQGSGSDASAGYHGYWVTDFTTIDPHFGTNAELKAFIADAHKRGIKVFFDIITNHTADVIVYEEQRYSYVSKADHPYRDADGNPFDDRDFVGPAKAGDFPRLDAKTSFPYTPVFRSEEDKTVKVPDWLNDPTLYHNRGDSTWAGESNTYGDFVGLDDLFTEHPRVVKGMTEVYQAWVDFGIDGFRIDTAKHVNTEFWQQFAPAIRAHAKAQGNDDFMAFGEVYDSSPAYMSRYTTAGKLDATLDFGFQDKGVAFAKGAATTKIRDFFAADDYYTDTDSNAYSLPTFLGNHDMGRVGYFLQSAYSGDELLARDRLAHELMFLTRGQPVIYYGDEQGFAGDGGDKDARQDMFASSVASYNDDDLIGTNATTAVDNFDRTHPLYRQIAALSGLKKQHPALADGAQLHRYASNNAGIYAFSRIAAGENREYLVAVNNADTATKASFEIGSPHTTLRQIYPTGRAAVRSDAEKRVTVTVPARAALVWRADSALPKATFAPALHFEKPSAGGVVARDANDRAEVSVGVPAGGFNQVSFAYRPVGGSDWTPLGTDDNAPYRVFQDVAGLKDGTLFEYRAVLKDHSGNLSVTNSYGTVGDAPSGGGEDPGGPTGPITQPDAVSMPGSHNSELGCGGDWQPDCDQAQLALDAKDEVWKKTVNLPAGSFEYKAAINKSWDENYGQGGAPAGANVPLELAAGGDLTFYYDHASHWITTDAQGPIITLAGSFQDELGCPGDWAPDCMRGWLKDPDGDGTYTFSTTALPAGSYETKVTHGLSWAENYGADGVPAGPNISFDAAGDGSQVVFSYNVESHMLTITSRSAGAAPDLTKLKAYWVARDLIAWKTSRPETKKFRLHWSADADLAVDAENIEGGDSAALTYDPAGLPAAVIAKFPHLKGYAALRLTKATARQVGQILRGQVAVAAYDSSGALIDATGLQTNGVLDDVYAAAARRELGPTWRAGTPTLSLWAPTAKSVALKLLDGNTPRTVAMSRESDGTWTVHGKKSWHGASYAFDVTVYVPREGKVITNTVTDPYSVALTTNSARSVLVDLNDPALAPAGWSKLQAPTIAKSVDRTIYELHIRDFSIGDQSVPAAKRGTYLAFDEPKSTGMQHLKTLADAGLNTVHLLPAFDIATIEERRAAQATPDCDLVSFAPDSEEQQACIEQIRAKDGFNWGYDPFHYTTPEGSYATNPEGASRTKEFRTMVAALNRAGLQVVMDVVYNHTAANGQDPKSVLDRIVPSYYHRLNATGDVENSTCCSNIASENLMMEKLMVDSIVTWARDYKVNAFRFDLMGHHSLQNLKNVRAALDKLTVKKDGVDGTSVYLYGEGWNFGEVADDARFVQATQKNLAGTGIGSFNDRLRDAVRGGGPFDDDPRAQGFGSGLLTDSNGAAINGSAAEQAKELALNEDLTKVGLAGNLADFSFASSAGGTITGAEVDYNGEPAGYAAEPGETVNYVDAHDNETLFDSLTYKLPRATSMADRVRMNTVSLSTVTLSQGVSFWHAGVDLLRSKSLDRNSYDSGDWFNRIDWTGEENTFGSGLPLKADNAAKWTYQKALLDDPSLKPDAAAIKAATAGAQELLSLRKSSQLFRLGSAKAIQQKVSFLDAPDGVIAMLIDDTVGTDADPERDGILVVFNATPDRVEITNTGAGWLLHPVQARGADPVVKNSKAEADTVQVPGRTTAVFQR